MSYHREISVSLLRVGLGVNIFLHGFVRFFDYGKFVDGTVALFKDSPLPELAVQTFAYMIPTLEAIIGFLVLIGLFTFPALIAGFLVVLVLMIGMCTLQKWDIVSLQMSYLLVYAILIFALDKDRFSVDRVMRKINYGNQKLKGASS